jgi:hypothetical protein
MEPRGRSRALSPPWERVPEGRVRGARSRHVILPRFAEEQPLHRYRRRLEIELAATASTMIPPTRICRT